MRDPQAAHRLGACCAALVTLLLSLAAHDVGAQIRGRPPVGGRGGVQRAPGWWLSGGANAVSINSIADGATNARWELSGDPRWQFRLGLEKALDAATTLGVTAAYGNVDVAVSRLDAAGPALPDACGSACTATADLWSLMAQFHSGGGSGFHGVLEGTAGLTGVQRLVAGADKTPLAPSGGSWDFTATLGFGFALPLDDDFQVTLVQDYGIGWHASTALPSGVNRTWRIRTTRAGLRFGFGALR